jgi:hypothetical protein
LGINKMKYLLAALALLALSAAGAEERHNVRPPQGYVPDATTAIRIAEAVWEPIYGKKQIENARPFTAVLKDGVWHVSGSLPKGWLGGVPEAEISKATGEVLRVTHGK